MNHDQNLTHLPQTKDLKKLFNINRLKYMNCYIFT